MNIDVENPMSFSTEQQQIQDLIDIAICQSDYGCGTNVKYDEDHDITFGDIVCDINDEGHNFGYVSGIDDEAMSEHVHKAPYIRISYADGSCAWVKYSDLQLVSEADPHRGISRTLVGGTLFCPICGEQCHGDTCVMADELTGLCYIGYAVEMISRMLDDESCLAVPVRLFSK